MSRTLLEDLSCLMEKGDGLYFSANAGEIVCDRRWPSFDQKTAEEIALSLNKVMRPYIKARRDEILSQLRSSLRD